jgi:hypothetical protein
MLDDAVVSRFFGIFRGNMDFYIKHQRPFIAEESGKLRAKYCNFAKYTKRNTLPEGKEYGDYMPVTRDLYVAHLSGGDGLALAPIMNVKDKKNMCFYAVIDIDVYRTSFTWLVIKLRDAGLKFIPFLSKSGGLHIYFFFSAPEPADKVIEAVKRVVEAFALSKIFRSGNISKVEVFPKQSVFVPGDKSANCLFLPYYNAANPKACKNKMLTAENKLIGLEKALDAVENAFTSVREINAVLDALPYYDAPYCIQALLLTGILGEGDGRNNFLFYAAIYLKKKYKDNFKEYLEEMNSCLKDPLEQEDIDSIFTSVTTNGYDNYKCGSSPLADFCDKKICALREYGVGKERGNRFTGADCWGVLWKVTAEEPYYLWDVRVKPEDEFRKIRVNSVSDLRNQASIQDACLAELNWTPFRVKDNDWAVVLNRALEGVEQRLIPVARETDTSEMNELRGLFLRFLTHRQAYKGQPAKIRLGQVYYEDGTYYFSTEGIMSFLRREKFTLGKVNLREQLYAYGCLEGELKYTASGEERVIKCWKKPEDEELQAMGAYYDDVYEADMVMIEGNPLDKEGKKKEGDNGEDTKF